MPYGTLQGTTDSGFESETGVSDDDVWFSFTATSASHKISLQDVNANVWAGYDLTMEVIEGACGALSIVEGGTTYNLKFADLAPGTVYYVRVYSTSESIVDTTFDICVGTTPTVPVNDDCEGAIDLNVDAAYCNGVLKNGTNVGETDSGIDAPDCFN